MVPCGVFPLASQGSEDPAPLTVAGERPSHTGQPPQALATPKLGDVARTPSTSRSKYSGSQVLTPGAYNALRAVLDEHEDASKEEKMHLMLSKLMSSDASFHGSLTGSRSYRSRSERTHGSPRSVKNSTESAMHVSLTRAKVDVTPRAGCSRGSPNRLELTRDWARMVQTGGVTVKEGTSCYFKDSQGIDRFVEPPTGSRSGGGGNWDRCWGLRLFRLL